MIVSSCAATIWVCQPAMLKRIRQFRAIQAIQARRLSTASSPYDNYTKLRALPFNLSPEKAQRMLASYAAVTCNFGKILPSLATLVFPLSLLDFGFLRPARFSAVYFPAWFVTGEVEANVTYKGVKFKGSAWFDKTYFPGSHFGGLSTAPLRSSSLIGKKTVPFTTSLLHQHGMPVQCIPFSTSPFSVLDMAASHPPSRSITINEDLSIDPSSVKPNLISAYPVLLPLYLAQYEIQGQKDSANSMFTFILIAHNYRPRIDSVMCENLSKIDKIFIREAIERATGRESSGDIYPFYKECPRVSMPEISIVQGMSISEWLEELLRSSSNIEIMARRSLGMIGKGDKDLRMREMTSEEGASLKTYTDITKAVMSLKHGLSAAIVIERQLIGKPGLYGLNLSKVDKKTMEEQIKRLEAMRARSAPKWWSEWLASN